MQVLDGVSLVSVDTLRTALVALDDSAGMMEAGKRLVELLCQHGALEAVKVLSATPMGYSGERSSIVRECVADYDVVDYEHECDGVDVAFCFLGCGAPLSKQHGGCFQQGTLHMLSWVWTGE